MFEEWIQKCGTVTLKGKVLSSLWELNTCLLNWTQANVFSMRPFGSILMNSYENSRLKFSYSFKICHYLQHI